MFDVISTAKNTQWFSFPSLCTKYTYSHVANEAVDFQTIPNRNCFAEFNKKSGFELLRTVNKNYVDSIQRIKKRQIEDLSCGAVSKLYGSELAVGMSTGVIQIFSIEKGDFLPFKFKPDKHGNSVNGLDYSNDDEYLAAVYESGDICLFGMKTGIKTDSFALDRLSTLIRFHPVKKFALAAASFEGAVTMLDVQTKKKLFYDKAAHSAPTRDISMFSSSQDLFVSCGYDCNINVYDLRKRTMVQQYTQPHPMSTVCVSSCGTFCVAGNLKGDVISFDFRNMKEPMDTKRAHDSAVIRVAFVPVISDASNTMFGQSINMSTMDVAAPTSKGSPKQTGMDSFAKFVDVCRKENVSDSNESKASHQDSWADLMPTKKMHNMSNVSAFDSPGRMSIDSANRSELRLKRPSRLSLNQSALYENGDDERRESVESDDVPAKLDKVPEMDEVSSPKKARLPVQEQTPVQNKLNPQMPILSPDIRTLNEEFSKNLSNDKTSTPAIMQVNNHRSRSGVIRKEKHALHQITEEVSEIDGQDKENRQNNRQDKPLAGSIQTPLKMENGAAVDGELITVNVNELQDVIHQRLNGFQTNLMAQLSQWENTIIDYVETRIKESENDANFNQEMLFNKDFTHRFESNQISEKNMQTIEEGLAALLHVETVEEKLAEYQTEIITLRRQLEQRSSK